VTDFDDFDWVDSTSGRGRGKNGPSDSELPRTYDQPRGTDRSGESARPASPGQSRGVSLNSQAPGPRGSAPSRGPVGRGGPARPGGPSGPRNGGRRPRRTIWSQLVAAWRSLFKIIGALPRALLIGVGVVVFFVSLTMVMDSALYYNKVHAGVNVATQGLGGKTYDQALGLVDQKAKELRTQPITLVSGSKTWKVTPEDVGQIIDPDATVTAAMQASRKSNLIADLARRFRLYFSDDNLSLVGEVDKEKLAAFVATITGPLDVRPINMRLSVQSDKVETVQGVPGYVVDQEKLRALLMEALFSHNTTQIQVPMMTKSPEVVAASTDAAVAQVQTMLSGDVRLTYLAPVPPATTTPTSVDGQTTSAPTVEQAIPATPQQTTTTTMLKTPTGDQPFYSKTETFGPEEIKDYLDYRVKDLNGVNVLVPFISPDKMRPFFSKIEGPMTVAAVDAYFYTDGANALRMKGKEGTSLDHEATAAALTTAALSNDNRSATAQRKNIEPDFTTAEADAMGITTLLGEWTEVYDKGTPAREWNVRLATAKIAGPLTKVTGSPFIDAFGDVWNVSVKQIGNRIIAPGEEFDFAKTLGPRTPEAGFALAKGIVDGSLEDVYGGGICQVSTTLFNALLQAGLKITERHNHSIFITHYPAGMDATVTGGGKPLNLKFVNDTPNYIWLYGTSDGTTTRFVIYGTSDGRKSKMKVSKRYDVTKNSGSTITTLDETLGFNSTTVVFDGQDGFKLNLTRVITWPNGSTTSETWISQWSVMTKKVAFPTAGMEPVSPNTATTLTRPPGN
jgi:vancomycin resistance protein YoaR